MGHQEKKEELAELNPDIIFFDGLEDALIGSARSFGRTLAVYDYDKSVEILMYRDGSTRDMAVERLETNALGVGPGDNMQCLFVKTEPLRARVKCDADLHDLSGKKLIDALNEARHGSDFKGWSFSEVASCTGVLPMTVYDHEAEGQPITKHIAVVSYGVDKGKVWSMTLATTTVSGTEWTEFVMKRPKSPINHIVDLFRQIKEEDRGSCFDLLKTLF